MTALNQETDEQRLVEAAQRDPAGFAALYELHFERVYAYVARRLSDRHEAEDLTAEVFRRALENIGRFEWRGAPFAAWLYRIAANAITDRHHRAARELPDPVPDTPVETDLEAAEHRARLYRLVSRLPADQRRVVLLRFVQQRSIREIARDLQRSEGAVKQLQFRALESLRTQMRESHG